MQAHRQNSFSRQSLTARSLRGSASDVTHDSREHKECDDQNKNIKDPIKWHQVVMVNEHKESDDDDDVESNKFRKLFRKRNRKGSGKKIASNPSASVLVVSTRKQHKKQPLGITLRQENSDSANKSRGVYLTGIAPHSPFRAASRFVPHGSKILLVNGQPCPLSVKEVANRLLQVPQGAVLTLHFEVDNKNSTNKKTSSKLSLFRKSNNMLNPIDNENRHSASDYAFQQNLHHLRLRKQPPSILKTPKYSQALTNRCSAPSAMQMLVQTAVLPFQAAKLLHDEAVTELDELGKFLTKSWNTTPKRFACGADATTTLLEETNSRWASIKADELAEF